MSKDLTLLTVHAHPDDEASKGAGTVAKYSVEGARTVLVCCTGGEEGETVDGIENGDALKELRLKELQKSAEIIGYREVEFLGYRDSGMQDSEANNHPNAFSFRPLEEIVESLVVLIRRVKPDVIITYPDGQGGYQHPDHLRVHDASVKAFDVAGDVNAFPEAGKPFEPKKLYFTVWSRARIESLHSKFLELKLDSPYDEAWFKRPPQDDKVTTRIDVEKWYDRRCEALLAHASQIDSESPFWFGLPRDVAASVYPYDDYVLVKSKVKANFPESDIFEGIR